MMDELAAKLETWQQPSDTNRGSFSILYSDIGQKFYAKHGWKPMPSTHIILSSVEKSAYTETVRRLGLPCVKDLRSQDLPKICQAAIEQVESELIEKSTNAPDKVYVAVRPDIEHMVWHHAREEFQARTLYNSDPLIKGAVDENTGCALIWCRVYAEKPEQHQIQVLKTIVPSDTKGASTQELERSLAALLLRAQLEAHAWSMPAGVEVWSPDQMTLAAAQKLAMSEEKIKVFERADEHVCSLRWIGGEEGDVVEWLANEKYAWC